VEKKVSFARLTCSEDILMRIAIESRVARIKARVAELTGNMEANGSPTTRSPVRSPVSARQ
jgi:hypothetical protein